MRKYCTKITIGMIFAAISISILPVFFNSNPDKKNLSVKAPEAQAAAVTCKAKLDLIVGIDVSGSMPAEEDVACNKLIDAINELNADPLYDIHASVAAIGSIDIKNVYKDKPYKCMADGIQYKVGQAVGGLTSNAEDFANAVYDLANQTAGSFVMRAWVKKTDNKILAKSGDPDGEIITKSFWRADATRVVVPITDECIEDGGNGVCYPDDLLATDRAYYKAKSKLDTINELKVLAIAVDTNNIPSYVSLSYTEGTVIDGEFVDQPPNSDANGNGVTNETVSFSFTGGDGSPIEFAKRMVDIDGAAGPQPMVGVAILLTHAGDLSKIIGDFAGAQLLLGLDKDEDGHLSAACFGSCPSGKTCDDHYDKEEDAPESTKKQRADTLNDLDLDGFPRSDAVGITCTSKTCESPSNDKNGCINPRAVEGVCPYPAADPTKECLGAEQDTVTGRVPYNAENTSPPNPVLPHPWDLCQVEAYYGCGLTRKNVPQDLPGGFLPPNPHPLLGTLIKTTYQCLDGIDNDLDGLQDSQEPECDLEKDLDGDGVVAATHADCTDPDTNCDFYDDPDDFRVNLRAQEPAGESQCWLQVFKNTKDNDLDRDGVKVAKGRLGQLNAVLFNREVPDPPEKYNPAFKWRDWYDNPFASSFPAEPTLAQLAGTINDIDWDTFISEGWGKKFIDAAKNWWQMGDWEPDSAEIVSGLTGNVGGCVYPNSTGPPYLEGTCKNCVVDTPNAATGRMPPGKFAPSIPLALNPPKVCQIEAYYEYLNNEKIPYRTICPTGCNETGPGPIPGKPLLTLTAQCRDGKDNDLNDLTDGSDLKCPITGGIVACGRYADDYRTTLDESAPCTFCHFFYLFERVMNNFVWRIIPILALGFIVAGGFFFITSVGDPKRVSYAKNMLVWTVAGYVTVLIGWIIINAFLAQLGVTAWTGLSAQQGSITSVAAGGLTICDSSGNWTGDGAGGTKDQWQNIAISIVKSSTPQLAGQVRIIGSNTKNCVTLKNAFGAAPQVGDEFKIGGWWQFVCEAK